MEKTVAFYGGDSQTGTTMLAVSTAVLMARQGKRVLMIAASDHSGDLWIPTSEGNFLDDLLTDLQEHSLTWEKIRQYILTEAGVDFYGYMTPGEYLKLCGKITGMTFMKRIYRRSAGLRKCIMTGS